MNSLSVFEKTTVLAVPFLACLCAPVVGQEKIVIAHRGASGYLPEHTLEAYAVAYAQGADFIEPDVVMTKEGRFVCLHDIHLEGTTNVEDVFPDRKREDGRWYAIDFTLDEIKRLEVHERLGNRFPRGRAKFEVPTFEEMIELVQGLNKTTGRNVGIYPELKGPGWHRGRGLAMEEAFLDVVHRYGYRGKEARIFVQCFDRNALKRMRRDLESELPHIFLFGDDKVLDPMMTEQGLKKLVGYVDGLGPDKRRVERDPDLVKRAHACGLLVHPYTVRADSLPPKYASMEEELEQLYFAYGVDGLFTDFPDRAVGFLSKREAME